VKIGSGVSAGTGSSLVVVFLLIVLISMGSILSAFGSYIYQEYIFPCQIPEQMTVQWPGPPP
jgi:hypothetical protein